ncbi:mechanosensitive ion channel [candidate division KSB1 bacterium]|nr:mechanosensitive ion channel [candidate division KSB1 bacterium]
MDITNILQALKDILYFPLFKIKQTDVTLASLIVFTVVVILFVIMSRLFSRMIMSRVLSRMNIDRGTRYTLKRITEYSITTIGVIIAFQFINISLGGLAVIFGLLSVGIGFGLQNVTSNFVAGLILLFEKPIMVGDRIIVGQTEGDVEEINIRSTTVRSLNNISIIVPNSEFISSQVVNWSHGDPKVRLVVDIGVSYNSDLDLVLKTLHEIADENKDVLKSPTPDVIFREFGDSSWNLQLRVWILDPTRHHFIRSDINCAIVRKFRQNNIEIPFPQRDLHVRSPLPVPFLNEKKN